MQYELSQREIWAIQDVLNSKGRPAVEVKIENGKVAIVKVERTLVKK